MEFGVHFGKHIEPGLELRLGEDDNLDLKNDRWKMVTNEFCRLRQKKNTKKKTKQKKQNKTKKNTIGYS